MADIFLSYNRDDQAAARKFAEGFAREGFSVWWDQTLRSGENYDQVTESALREARAVVVLWSKKSVDSRWVRAEATTADRAGTLVPAMIEPCNRPIMFELKQTAELAHWKGDAGDPAWRSFLADVRVFVGRDAGPAAAPAIAPRRPGTRGRTIGVAAAVLLLVGAGIWALTHMAGERPAGIAASSAIQSPAASAPAAATEVTLAVLPFANLSSDPEQEYFSDGLTEEILNQLAQIQALRVTGRTSSFSFKGKNEDLRVIGEKLGVANLLEGSIRKNGQQLRITAQLIDSRSGTHIWSQTYARELKDVFAIQEEIAKDVARALSIKLEVGDMSRALGGTTNLEAYEKFLRARNLQLQWGPRVFEATQLFREAIALDPQFWRAWFGLRSALSTTEVLYPDRIAEFEKELGEVRAHLVAEAPDSWAKQVMLASYYYFEQRKWLDSDKAINAAIAGMPASEVDGRITIGILLLSAGRAKESLPFFERAARIDPLTTAPSAVLQGALSVAGRAAESRGEYARGRPLSGSHEASEWVELQRVLATGVRREIREFVQSSSTSALWSVPWKALYDKLESAPAERKAAVQKALRDPAYQSGRALRSILWFADGYDDRDSTLMALRQIVTMDPRGHPYLWQAFRTSPRADSRFKDLVRDLGLVDYWRATGSWGDFCKPVGTGDFECL